MKIRYKRSGGFANISSTVELDSAKLPQKKAKELKSLVNKAKFFQQPADVMKPSHAADDFEHEVEISDGARSHTVRRLDSQSTKELIRLFDRLHEESKK
jgi:hypothetical protein